MTTRPRDRAYGRDQRVRPAVANSHADQRTGRARWRSAGLCITVGTGAQWLVEWSGIPARFEVPARAINDDELRLRGLTVLLALPLASVAPLLGGVVLTIGWCTPRWLERRRDRRGDDEIAAQLVMTVDLLAVSARAGATVPGAIDVVGARVPGRVGRGLRRVGARVASDERLDDALIGLGADLGPSADPLVAVLRSAYLDGAPLAPALGQLAVRMNDERRRGMEAQARRLSVRLLIPLVCCLLPAFALIAVVPVLIDSLRVLAR